MNNHFDFIICGGGLSGVMLADQLCKDPFFNSYTILLLEEKKPEMMENKIWSFWEKENSIYPHLVTKIWKKGHFISQKKNIFFSFAPYRYKSIKSNDFFKNTYDFLFKRKKITIKQEKVIRIVSKRKKTVVFTNKTKYYGKKTFSSIFDLKKIQMQKKYPYLKQHFVGWVIKTKDNIFEKNNIEFMNFNIPQYDTTRFMYVLPFSENEALLEYTIFSKKLLHLKDYKKEIKSFISKNNIEKYTILAEERGNIPMTCFDFTQKNTPNLLYIGTAGGWTKASTGYTFKKIFENTQRLIKFLKKEKNLTTFTNKTKFWLYDLLFIDVLNSDNEKGNIIFERLFSKNPPRLIFKFLDEKTSFWEDLKILFSLPKIIFLKALFDRILKF